MTKAEILQVVQVGWFVLQLVLPPALVSVPWPGPVLKRAVLAIVISWVVIIFYTVYIYNPAGIAAGHEAGMHFPEMKYDNNTTGSVLLGGWAYPAIAVLLYLRLGKLLQTIKAALSRK